MNGWIDQHNPQQNIKTVSFACDLNAVAQVQLVMWTNYHRSAVYFWKRCLCESTCRAGRRRPISGHWRGEHRTVHVWSDPSGGVSGGSEQGRSHIEIISELMKSGREPLGLPLCHLERFKKNILRCWKILPSPQIILSLAMKPFVPPC